MSPPQHHTSQSLQPVPVPTYHAPVAVESSDDIRRELAAASADERNATALQPDQCPQAGCVHRMPNDTSTDKMLSRLLKRRIGVLLESGGESCQELMHLNTEICVRISHYGDIDVARTQGWPLTLDPELISQRVLNLRDTLQETVDKPSEAFTWQMLCYAFTPQLELTTIASLFEGNPCDRRLMDLLTSLRVG